MQSRQNLAAKGWYERGYLPHFDGGQFPQHVIFRLADSFASRQLDDWNSYLQNLPDAQAKIERRRRIDEYLDMGHGEAWLSNPAVAAVASQNLLHFDKKRYALHAWCIMPNHIHVLFTPADSLPKIVHSWKSYIATKSNAILGRKGCFWAREYFDRCIRDELHFQKTIAYIENNPVKAGLCTQADHWRFSSAFRVRQYKADRTLIP